MNNHFFAYLSRMKLIKRWSLMRNIEPENIAEHSLQVAVIAHALAEIDKRQFGGNTEPGEVVLLALYHDAGEVLIGDLPTPVKYFNPQIKEAYGQIEEVAKHKLLGMLPPWLGEAYRPLLFAPQEDPADKKKYRLVKAADKISAYLKCVEEGAAGNGEFSQARPAILAELAKFDDLPAVDYFMRHFAESFAKTLDELG